MMTIIIDAFPIINLQFSGGQGPYKSTAAASTSHAEASFSPEKVNNHPRMTCSLKGEAVERGREVKEERAKSL